MSAYYNEFDPYAAAWLRNLIVAGLVAPGDVDERSIVDVRPDDLKGYTQCHFFAGIGGWSLALRMAGWNDKRPVWTGSCPCQPFSNAGLQQGTSDERHLWPQLHRLVAECRPPVVFGEQVASKLGRGWLAGVRVDLETLGYGVGAADLCAAGVGAPHIRQRLWWVADSGCISGARWRGVGHVVGSPRVVEREARERQRVRNAADDGRADGGLADSRHGTGTWSNVGSDPAKGSGGREGASSSGLRSEDGGMGYSERWGSQGWNQRKDKSARSLEQASCQSGMAHAESSGLHQQCRASGCAAGEGRTGYTQQFADSCRTGRAGWSGTVWIPCADGKARRIEPGLEPLAHGVPARVGRLRAYGNAIVPEVAAAFIGACDWRTNLSAWTWGGGVQQHMMDL